jgi:hypothetical protein
MHSHPPTYRYTPLSTSDKAPSITSTNGKGTRVSMRDESTVVRVVGVCMGVSDFSQLDAIQTLARGCGLCIVGCCIGLGQAVSTTATDPPLPTWTPAHVYAALSLRKVSPDPGRFVVMNAQRGDTGRFTLPRFVSRSVGAGRSRGSRKRQGGGVGKDQSGTSLEAYFLSDQGVELCESGILPPKSGIKCRPVLFLVSLCNGTASKATDASHQDCH